MDGYIRIIRPVRMHTYALYTLSIYGCTCITRTMRMDTCKCMDTCLQIMRMYTCLCTDNVRKHHTYVYVCITRNMRMNTYALYAQSIWARVHYTHMHMYTCLCMDTCVKIIRMYTCALHTTCV